uniref:Otolin-1 n=1 Tax=Oncorhynchus mykiss TaxID=8022 RepID=A0A8C7TNM7_ONCMY
MLSYHSALLAVAVMPFTVTSVSTKTTQRPKYQYTKKPMPYREQPRITMQPLTTIIPNTLKSVDKSDPMDPYPLVTTETTTYPSDSNQDYYTETTGPPGVGHDNYTLDYNECYFNFCECCLPEKGPRGPKGGRGLPGEHKRETIHYLFEIFKGDRGYRVPSVIYLSFPGTLGIPGKQGESGNQPNPLTHIGTYRQRNHETRLPVPVPGTLGLPGVDGMQGSPGVAGDQGDPGPPGAQGEPGVRGLPGHQGGRGIGDRGPRGIRGAKGNGVSVGLSPSKSFPPSGFPVRFDKVFHNGENHYNSSSNSFTCAHGGVYMFSYHITVRNKPLRAALVVNGVRKVRTRDSPYGQDIDQAYSLVLLQLAAGDQVWLETLRDWNGVYASSDDDSTFSGFLLYADKP